jgi:signal transduction histidine kinase
VDLWFTQFKETRSLLVNSIVLGSILLAFVVNRLGYFRSSVVLIGLLILVAMVYQSLVADTITTSSMAVVMVIGFGFSVLLNGKLSIALHALTIFCMVAVFAWLAMHPSDYAKNNMGDIVIAGVTYLVLYSVISYSSFLLKKRYDEMFLSLREKNIELFEKSNEIEAQNEELLQSQQGLSELNNHLENLVNERTHEVKKQNEQLIRYAFSNAHHLRGPVARLLGLIQISKLDTELGYEILFDKIKAQTEEIDEVVRRINRELEV